jgi:hypothetical protein
MAPRARISGNEIHLPYVEASVKECVVIGLGGSAMKVKHKSSDYSGLHEKSFSGANWLIILPI